MSKQKTKKSFFKRVKITASGKILRSHQFGSGHLKRKKSKSALRRQKQTSEYFHGESKSLRKLIGA
ncbi:MAG: bL35 family ribosomal protein [Candidatus Daviesbacteria bacterium]|nr:bL35 family ribosomal protein [Candidatus Daviesbacteria bacterium]